MINIFDLVLGAWILFFLLKNSGGISKTVKNFLVVIAVLVIFGIVAQIMLGWQIPKPVRETLSDSYFVKLSVLIIKTVYPTVENSAPKINSFMKDKIISLPTPEVEVPKVTIPNVTIPSLPSAK
jgi:hypothetical protein